MPGEEEVAEVVHSQLHLKPVCGFLNSEPWSQWLTGLADKITQKAIRYIDSIPKIASAVAQRTTVLEGRVVWEEWEPQAYHVGARHDACMRFRCYARCCATQWTRLADLRC